MAAGEYVSVSSQADTEQADLKRERHELATQPEAEEDELTGIYVRRGLDQPLRARWPGNSPRAGHWPPCA